MQFARNCKVHLVVNNIMAKNHTQNYSYANNLSGELINVSNAQRSEQYFCPICGEPMTPHMGKIRRWHFVHNNANNCSYESYLHKLAKIKIQKAFLSSEHFILSYTAKAICSFDCPFINYSKCEGGKPVEFDLKKYYDSCKIESSYNRYIADLLLSSSINPNLPPILIEIMVTHKCTEDKIKDGVRIIEIPIQCEEDIDEIANNCYLPAVRYNESTHFSSNEKNITLYNFNKVESFDPRDIYLEEIEDCFNRKDTIVFYINKQGYFRSFDCRCYEVRSKLPNNVHYFLTQIATPFKEIFQEFSKRGVKIRNCFLCRFSKQDYYGDRICVLYKKHNLPRKPSPYSATSCIYYREDFEYKNNCETNEQSQLIEGYDCNRFHKFYYYVCKEIL